MARSKGVGMVETAVSVVAVKLGELLLPMDVSDPLDTANDIGTL